ncbi:hypothetical protein RCL1_006428 [Eukaryota sp. TZLM3-RCL]
MLCSFSIIQPGRHKYADKCVLFWHQEKVYPDHIKDNIIRLSLGIQTIMSTFSDEPVSTIACDSFSLVYHITNGIIFVLCLSIPASNTHITYIAHQLLQQTSALLHFRYADITVSDLSLYTSSLVSNLILPNLSNILSCFPGFRSLRLSEKLFLGYECFLSRLVYSSSFTLPVCPSAIFHYDRLVHSQLTSRDNFITSLFLKQLISEKSIAMTHTSVHDVKVFDVPVFLSGSCSKCNSEKHNLILIQTGPLSLFLFTPIINSTDFVLTLENFAAEIVAHCSSQLLYFSSKFSGTAVDSVSSAITFNSDRSLIDGTIKTNSKFFGPALVKRRKEFESTHEKRVICSEKLSTSEYFYAEKIGSQELYLLLNYSGNSLIELDELIATCKRGISASHNL